MVAYKDKLEYATPFSIKNNFLIENKYCTLSFYCTRCLYLLLKEIIKKGDIPKQ